MELDFTALNSLRGNTNGQPVEEKPTQAILSGTKVQRDKDYRVVIDTVFAEYQKNIKISEKLRSEISIGLKTATKDNLHIYLQMAIECIGLMAHDKPFIAGNSTIINKIIKGETDI